MTGITPSTEPYALLFARKIRGKLATTWSLGETGTAGPTGSRYGHAAGHSCIAVIGPNGERSMTVETGKATASTICGRSRSPRSTCWRKRSAEPTRAAAVTKFYRNFLVRLKDGNTSGALRNKLNGALAK